MLLICLVSQQLYDIVAGCSPIERIQDADIAANALSEIPHLVRFPLESLPYSFYSMRLVDVAVFADNRLGLREGIAAALCYVLQLVFLLAAEIGVG